MKRSVSTVTLLVTEVAAYTAQRRNIDTEKAQINVVGAVQSEWVPVVRIVHLDIMRNSNAWMSRCWQAQAPVLYRSIPA